MTGIDEPILKTWEIDVELRVRKTLLIVGPRGADVARSTAELLMRHGLTNAEMSAFLKWSDGRQAYRPAPVETIIDNDPKIVAVREVLP
jgi:hypothetical protein